MKRIALLLVGVAALAGVVAATAPSSRPADAAARAIDQGKLPTATATGG